LTAGQTSRSFGEGDNWFVLIDSNGSTWERFTAKHQQQEIDTLWPEGVVSNVDDNF
jgi:hypothetical protein